MIDVIADVSDPQVKAMNQAGRVDWDTAFLQAAVFPPMNDADMFVPIDYNLWNSESLEGTPKSVRLKTAVPVFASAQLLVSDKRAFGGHGPQNWADFWNVKAFPGPRGLTGLAATARIDMVIALLADGVARSDVWPFTDDKIDRALKKLDETNPYVAKWWTAGSEPNQLLINREVVMTSCFDGRTISSIRQGAPVQMAWDGAYVSYTYGVVLNGGPNTENARKLIAFLNRAAIAAGFTLGTGYPGPNTNQLKHLPSDLVPLLSINPANASKVVHEDSAWLAAKRPDGQVESRAHRRPLARMAGTVMSAKGKVCDGSFGCLAFGGALGLGSAAGQHLPSGTLSLFARMPAGVSAWDDKVGVRRRRCNSTTARWRA